MKIYDNGNLLGTALVDGDGNWNFTPTSPLGDGTHSFTATATSGAGVTSLTSPAFTLNVDHQAPNAPLILNITDDVAPVTGLLLNGQHSNDTRPTLNGRGEAGSTITVYDNGTVIGLATVDNGGEWHFTPGTALDNGDHHFTVTATDSVGNTSPASGGWLLVVDTLPPATPAVPTVTDDTGIYTGALESGQATDETLPVIGGSGTPGDTITVYDGSAVLGTALVDGNGEWTFTPTRRSSTASTA